MGKILKWKSQFAEPSQPVWNVFAYDTSVEKVQTTKHYVWPTKEQLTVINKVWLLTEKLCSPEEINSTKSMNQLKHLVEENWRINLDEDACLQ